MNESEIALVIYHVTAVLMTFMGLMFSEYKMLKIGVPRYIAYLMRFLQVGLILLMWFKSAGG